MTDKIRRCLGQHGWLTKVWYDNMRVKLTEMVRCHGYRFEYDGNSKEGWYVFLRSDSDGGIDVSPYFGPDTGDTLRDLKAAFGRMYGTEFKLAKGRKSW
jgi:hypothetical protein